MGYVLHRRSIVQYNAKCYVADKNGRYSAGHLISIPRNKCGTLEFDRAAEMIEYGYRLAAEQLSGKL